MNELQWQLKESKKELAMWNRDHKSIYRESKMKELGSKIEMLEQQIFDIEYAELIALEKSEGLQC